MPKNDFLNCQNCLYYERASESFGVCRVSDLIIEGDDEACIDYQPKSRSPYSHYQS